MKMKRGKGRVLPLLLLVALTVTMAGCSGSKKPDLKGIYDEYCNSLWSEVGSDGSYLNIDTNPDDEDGVGIAYYSAASAIQDVNDALGLPESLYNDMSKTTALMGKQSETFSDVGITVSWSYHPDNGLEVTYKLINE